MMITGAQMAVSVLGKLQRATQYCALKQGQIAEMLDMRRERFNRIMNNREQPTLDEACIWAGIVGVNICAAYSTDTQDPQTLPGE